MKILKLTTLIAAITVMYNCNKHNDEKVLSLDGTYSGQLTQTITSTDVIITDNVDVKLASPKYSTYFLANSNNVTAEGGYKVSGSQVTFTDSLAIFDIAGHGVILNGAYTFKVKADSLILNQVIGNYNTTYRLKRQ
jgi:hypothetical protein